ncbi:unnamed protein product [Amoebophrya sp. A120]|nr:unnamed protein product [Amoebophrya sp. A120]|eukprot:GSA120T00021313001.1
MTKGAIHPNGSNFYRGIRYDVVQRVENLLEQQSYRERPDWLLYCQRVPPLELTNLQLQDKKIANPYRILVRDLLQKYPDLRFVDCFTDGNDWQQGNDVYRSDHPVMQFVSHQLRLMNGGANSSSSSTGRSYNHAGAALRSTGRKMTKQEAFRATEKKFRQRRFAQERQQKLLMSMMVGHERLQPLFTKAKDVLREKKCEFQVTHLRHIRKELANIRRNATGTEEQGEEEYGRKSAARSRASSKSRVVRGTELEKQRLQLLASTKEVKDVDLLLDDELDGLHPYHSIARERRKRQQKLVIQQMSDMILASNRAAGEKNESTDDSSKDLSGSASSRSSSGTLDDADVAQRLFGNRLKTNKAPSKPAIGEGVSASSSSGASVEREVASTSSTARTMAEKGMSCEEGTNASNPLGDEHDSNTPAADGAIISALAANSFRSGGLGTTERHADVEDTFRSGETDKMTKIIGRTEDRDMCGEVVADTLHHSQKVASPTLSAAETLQEKLKRHREKLEQLRKKRQELEMDREKNWNAGSVDSCDNPRGD